MIDVQGWLNTMAQVAIAGGGVYVIWQQTVTRRAATAARAQAIETGAEVAKVSAVVGTLLVQTNGMSHRLQQMSEAAGRAEGRAEGREEGREDEVARREAEET